MINFNYLRKDFNINLNIPALRGSFLVSMGVANSRDPSWNDTDVVSFLINSCYLLNLMLFEGKGLLISYYNAMIVRKFFIELC